MSEGQLVTLRAYALNAARQLEPDADLTTLFAVACRVYTFLYSGTVT